MKSVKTLTILLAASMFAYSCGSSQAADDKLAQLETKKTQLKELEAEIKTLETELIASGKLEENVNRILVTSLSVQPTRFVHKIEVRGSVESKKNVTLMSEAMGRITDVYASKGKQVKKGDLLIDLDGTVTRNTLAEVRTSLELATEVFERQKNLWEQNIGTEIQFLQAKNNKESLEKKLQTLQAQLGFYKVYAPFDGVIEDIPVKVGEMAQPGIPLVRMVNPKSMYITSDVSEAFLGKFKAGDTVNVFFPSQDQELVSRLSSVGQVINPENRTFEVEIELPEIDFQIKPNQVVVLNLKDYENNQAFVVPTKLIQSDSRGKYVYELTEKENEMVASRVYVEPGVTYNNSTEIKSGLTRGQTLALKGYRELSENSIVEITSGEGNKIDIL